MLPPRLPKRWIAAATAILLLVVLVAGCSSGAGRGQEQPAKRPIVFGDGSWDSIQVHSRIAAFILEHGYGYAPEFVPGETIPLFAGLARGDIDVIMEVWVENQQEAYDKAISANQVVDLGTNFDDNWQGWLVPTYVVKGDPARGLKPLAPDLKTVADLPRYWKLFQDPEDPSKGRFYSGVAGWEAQKIDELKFKAYDLNKTYNILLPGSAAALTASMVSAYEQGKPWLGYYWAPTWILGKLDMTPIGEPPFDAKTWEATHGCVYPAVKVNVVVNSSFPGRAPDAAEFLKNYKTTTAQNNRFLAFMQENKGDTQAAAVWFLKEYEPVWTQWVPDSVVAKVKAALP